MPRPSGSNSLGRDLLHGMQASADRSSAHQALPQATEDGAAAGGIELKVLKFGLETTGGLTASFFTSMRT